jgi:hypothetical protein
MARPFDYAEAYYHVTCRGNERRETSADCIPGGRANRRLDSGLDR